MDSGKNNWSIGRRIRSFGYAFKGLFYFIRTQPNAWIHLLAMAVVVGLGLFHGISRLEWLSLVICFGLVISAEAFNTAIETLTDLVSPGWNKQAGLVKDVAAGAVLICALSALVVGLLVFVPYWV